MTKTEIVEAIAALARPNGAFYGFQTRTTPRLTKKNRTTKAPTDFTVEILSSFSAMLGVNYENCVNNAKERNGEARDFVAQKPNGKHYVDGSRWLMAADKDESKFYVAVDKVGGVKRTFLINGRVATDEEVADLKENYLDKPHANPYGVTWRTYGVESIVSVK